MLCFLIALENGVHVPPSNEHVFEYDTTDRLELPKSRPAMALFSPTRRVVHMPGLDQPLT